MGLARYFLEESINEMGRELNEEIRLEVEAIKEELKLLSPDSADYRHLVQVKRELNLERAKALKMYFVKGEKE
jgi:hypothetical protein